MPFVPSRRAVHADPEVRRLVSDFGGTALGAGYIGAEASSRGRGTSRRATAVTKSRCASAQRLATYVQLSAEVTSMRSFLVGVAALVAMVGGPAYGGGIDDQAPRPRAAVEPEVIEAPVHEEHWSSISGAVSRRGRRGLPQWRVGVGHGVASAVLSIFYTPVRLTVGIAGAALGGVEGFLTGGNVRTARSMWGPTVEGDYFIRPDHLDGTEHFEFSNVRPIAHERSSLHGRYPTVREYETEIVPAAPSESVSGATWGIWPRSSPRSKPTTTIADRADSPRNPR